MIWGLPDNHLSKWRLIFAIYPNNWRPCFAIMYDFHIRPILPFHFFAERSPRYCLPPKRISRGCKFLEYLFPDNIRHRPHVLVKWPATGDVLPDARFGATECPESGAPMGKIRRRGRWRSTFSQSYIHREEMFTAF